MERKEIYRREQFIQLCNIYRELSRKYTMANKPENFGLFGDTKTCAVLDALLDLRTEIGSKLIAIHREVEFENKFWYSEQLEKLISE